MQADKKELEILLIDYFRASYPEFPKGRVVPAESPDFWVRKKNRNTIGIELTRLNPVHAAPPNEAQIREEQFWEEIIRNAKDIFERTSEKNLFVKFLFDEKKTISAERAMSVSVRVAGMIRNLADQHKAESFFQESIRKNLLPEGLEEILLVHHPKLQIPVWERSNNLGVSTNVVEDIRVAIQKKENKLRLYHKNHLNYYWLLIFTDRLRATKNFNLHNAIQNQHFESQFQRVFLFDLVKAKVYELV